MLGPAVDPMRCRALPGERELRALRPGVDGVLHLAQGVWFCGGTPRRAPEAPALDVRDYGEIFAMAFVVV